MERTGYELLLEATKALLRESNDCARSDPDKSSALMYLSFEASKLAKQAEKHEKGE